MANDRAPQRMLIVRLGAMGDIIHALPSLAALRRRYPDAHIAWLIERRWLPLLEGNPNLSEILFLERGSALATMQSALALRGQFDLAYDLQGLLKSAIPARMAASKVIGPEYPRERLARQCYTTRIDSQATHIVDQHMELISATDAPRDFWLPTGKPEGNLPGTDFVLASPAAGWASKEWPRSAYEGLRTQLAARNIPLVLNGAPGSGLDHQSSIAGLIHATRRARWIVGVDSGPLHIAAALGKPGVAIFGPTDPARNGPYGGTIQVLRAPNAETSYKRMSQNSASMEAISPSQVMAALGL
jgi:heptosyltransferase I